MRILMLATYFPKPTSAVMGTWALQEAQALRRQGAEVEVISPTSWVPRLASFLPKAAAWALCPAEHDWDGLRVHYPRWLLYQTGLPKRRAHRDPRLQLRVAFCSVAGTLEALARRIAPELIFAHHAATNGYAALRLSALLGVPFVVMEHDFDEVRDCERFPGRRQLFAEVVAGAARMIVYSRRMADDLRRLFPGVDPFTTPFGSDPFPPELLAVPRPPELAGRQVILAVAKLNPRKCVPELVRAFAAVAARFPDAVLRIAGDGGERPRVEQAIAAAGLAERVQLLGMLEHRAVLREMAWTDVFALIGRDEPFGVVFTEAMSAGKPILCCNDGGINDVLTDGVQGLAVPPGDVGAAAAALGRLLESGERRRAMGAAGRELFLGKLTWDAHARALLPVFAGAARGPRAAEAGRAHAG